MKLNQLKKHGNKKAAIFMMLDFWSIVAFVLVVIIFLVYINLYQDKKTEEINENIIGVNFPHFILNAFQSEYINLTTYNQKCSLDKEMTRIELLQWFAYMDLMKDNAGSTFYEKAGLFGVLLKEILPDDYTACKKAFISSLKDFDIEDLGVSDYVIFADLNYLDVRVELDSSALIHQFSFQVPSVKGALNVGMFYGYNQ